MKTTNFCINLDRRFDRWVGIQKRFADQNLDIHRWSAVDAKEYGFANYTGATCSHMSLLYFCKLAEIDNALVFEDDVVLCNNFNSTLEKILKYLPLDWDALSLHCFKAKTQKINDYICKLLSPTYGAHGILFNSKGINKVLISNHKSSVENRHFYSLDNFYAVNIEHTMAFQIGEDSDIPETSIIDEYRHFYNQYAHLHS